MKKLVKLSSVREQATLRKFAAAQKLLRERAVILEQKQLAARDLIQTQANQRKAFCSSILCNPQLNGEISAIMATFDADHLRENEAEIKIIEAEQNVIEAKEALAGVLSNLSYIRRQSRKREEFCRLLDEDYQRKLTAR